MKIEKVTEESVCDLFKQGIDCSQIVMGYAAGKLDVCSDQALKVSAAFGGGMWGGRTCAYISGVMARIPVAGTPLGDLPRISDEEIAKLIAVFRLSGGETVKHICVHPASELAVRSGANVVVVETGAIPRDRELAPGTWNRFDCPTATDLFTRNGYTLG